LSPCTPGVMARRVGKLSMITPAAPGSRLVSASGGQAGFGPDSVTSVAQLHLGLILPNYGEALDAARLGSAAGAAEAVGFDSGWVTDHLIVPPEHAPVYGTIAEGLVSLGFLAARTQRLELGVSALVVPQRNPLVALKQLTTLDLLSGGRIVTAVAAGWMAGEFALLGTDFERRGRLLDEWLELATSLFEQMPGRVIYEGEFFSVDGWLAPALIRPGGPELWVAGVSRATLRRAARTGVWHPVALRPEDLRPLAAELRGRRPDSRIVLRIGVALRPEPEVGRDERGRHAIAGPPEWAAEQLMEYLEAGCDGFLVNLEYGRPGLDERVLEFGEQVAAPLRRAGPRSE
jgi:alkanesulfonate monooxygenase SsuD/methylene tetrahydromethanopterin reductase-like flavin-dependent oxidoreductase (luciferase family)